MRAHFGLPSVEKEEVEGRPPIGVKFEIPYFTVSGIQVSVSRYLPSLASVGSPFSYALAQVTSVPWPAPSRPPKTTLHLFPYTVPSLSQCPGLPPCSPPPRCPCHTFALAHVTTHRPHHHILP